MFSFNSNFCKRLLGIRCNDALEDEVDGDRAADALGLNHNRICLQGQQKESYAIPILVFPYVTKQAPLAVGIKCFETVVTFLPPFPAYPTANAQSPL